MTSNLTIALIAKNAAKTIRSALESASFSNILIVDDQSEDETISIAREYTNNVIQVNNSTFAEKRNEALKHTESEWIFYLDTDEVITPELQKEIIEIINRNEAAAFKVVRHNYFLGKRMYDDRVDRLIHKSVLKGWQGKVHESPVVTAEIQSLRHPLTHHTHTDIASMLTKTNEWSELEADLRIEAHHPPVAWWRLFRMAISTLWQQLYGKKLWKYGRPGMYEAYFQMIDKLVVYTKLWEKQHS